MYGQKSVVFGTAALTSIKTLTHVQQDRRILPDFTVNTLAGMPSLYSRLIYVASLRDLSNGKYEHAGLLALYPEAAIQQALETCPDQVFEKILEMTLAEQEEELRTCLEALHGGGTNTE